MKRLFLAILVFAMPLISFGQTPNPTGLVYIQPSLGSVDLVNQSGTLGSTTIVSSIPAGNYNLHYYVNQPSACTGTSGSIKLKFTWNDSGFTGRSSTTGALSLTTTESTAANYMSGVFPIRVTASTTVTVTTSTFTACTSATLYDLHAWVTN